MTPEMEKTQADLRQKLRRQEINVKATETFIEIYKDLAGFYSDVARAQAKLPRQRAQVEHTKEMLAAVNKIQHKIGQAKK